MVLPLRAFNAFAFIFLLTYVTLAVHEVNSKALEKREADESSLFEAFNDEQGDFEDARDFEDTRDFENELAELSSLEEQAAMDMREPTFDAAEQDIDKRQRRCRWRCSRLGCRLICFG